MALDFSKYEGLGNDFILVDGAGDARSLGSVGAKRLCDRHFGIGADGVLFVGVQNNRPYMRVINADGSVPEMCGNGLRCAALYLADQGLVQGDRIEVDTDAGPHTCRLEREGRGAQVEVQMPAASLEAADVMESLTGRAVEVPFEVQGVALKGSAVSMGNPHFVVFDAPADRIDALGPGMSTDARFKAGANVGFARMTAVDAMDLRVNERGAGWTLACGTGACAAGAAAVETGRAERGQPLAVSLPGGTLQILVRGADEPIQMTGPARRVYDGQTDLHLESSP